VCVVTCILHEAVMGCFILAMFLGVALNITIRHIQKALQNTAQFITHFQLHFGTRIRILR
ncbi:hypothetical protein, partial [Saliterribacillus persicus]